MPPAKARGGFELFVARRYLRAKRKQAVISVITVISIVGVAAGVMALVIALAINNGFRNTLQRSLLGATAHVMILAKDPSEGITNWRELDPKLRRIPHVVSAYPVLYGQGLFTGPRQSTGAVLKGVPLDNPPDILQHLKQGSFTRLKDDGAIPGVILGSRLAESIGMMLNSVVTFLSPQGELTPFGPNLERYKFRVVGIFETGFYDIDSNIAFSSLPNVQTVFGLHGDVANEIEIKLDDLYRAPEVAGEVQKTVGPNLSALTWMEQFHQIMSALNMEKVVTAVTVGLIELVAALNILITLVMLVMEKNRDIAVLMSMGAKRQQIRKVFLYQGLIIGLIGTVIGLVLGYSLAILGDRFHWLPLNQDVYGLAYVPFAPRWADGIWIAAASIFVSFIATLYPARAATRIAPAEALRYE
ncbi:MAG TPA: ABC transporter permease [Bryobacteraceae bacterium]|nr:ABC transporter permease [Bryobacteraceae bacterium]